MGRIIESMKTCKKQGALPFGEEALRICNQCPSRYDEEACHKILGLEDSFFDELLTEIEEKEGELK